MLPENFEDILIGHTFVINLDRCIDRWDILKQRIEDAGFKPTRFSAVDGMKGKLKQQWYDFGVQHDVNFIFDSDGKSGCTISNAKVWQHMVDNNIPFANIFEDDILFHKDWHTLSPVFYEKTDKNIDIVYYGSQGAGTPSQPLITSNHVFCTHAYLITLEGAKKLLNQLRIAPQLYVIDCMIINMMKNPNPPFTWQCWNATSYHDPARNNTIYHRNDGLVYQDDSFESNINYNAPPELKD